MPRDTEHVVIYTGKTVNQNGRSQLGEDFPLAHGWYKANLRFKIVVTIGTATGAITNGELNIIKNILFRTDKGETICDLPGRALYNIATVKAGTTARKDAIAAASATYLVNIPLYFADERMIRPEDTILDTARYNSVTLDVTYGGVADLFTTPGTASLVVTSDFEVYRTSDVLPEEALPIAFPSYEVEPTSDPNSKTFIDMSRDINMSVKRMYVHTASGATAGQPFSGTNDDGVIDVVSLKDHNSSIIQDRVYEMVQDGNKEDYSLESVVSGLMVFDFVRDGSSLSSLYTGDLSKLQLTWTNDSGVAANDQVSIARESLRALV